MLFAAAGRRAHALIPEKTLEWANVRQLYAGCRSKSNFNWRNATQPMHQLCGVRISDQRGYHQRSENHDTAQRPVRQRNACACICVCVNSCGLVFF